MAQIIIKQSQLNLIQETIQLESKWSNLSTEEKEFVVEFLKISYPEKTKLIKEAKWYNTLGDIVGIFDPTGVVDLVNGVSYVKQGDYLFGFLSMVSAVPYIGDAIAKPVMEALKIGSPSVKALESVLKSASTIKTAEEATKVSTDLAKLSSQGGIVGKFVKGMGKVGGKLKGIIEKMPGGALKGLKNTLLEWINLFEKGAAKQIASRTAVGKLATEYGKLGKKFTDLEKARLASALSMETKTIKDAKGLFSGYRTPNKLFSMKTWYGGMPQIINRNKSVRALMRKTKFWAGFLDSLGIVNLVGPDEVEKKLGGADEMAKKMREYQQTPEAQQYFKEDFKDINLQGGQTNQQNQQSNQKSSQESNQKSDQGGFDPLGSVIGSLFI